ncbi:glucose PTS transporter subunit IIA [Lactococcus garvieae]|uniref:PTS system sucrose-specific EIIBCA component n=1 Tax=Lactococcus garvieae DCC43 TaxID=1231377 RepID=K2PW75_9LACT|nr:glucose PTS transporter subunit IIA [Lactococcus garvieae]EKF51641.1 PTS system, sucrose-specific IIB component / PTS system, sucrose-specific IIC component [Lactococcus garvieae DCC43]
MAEDKVTRIARQIYEEIGGAENVQSLVHCMTRVRLSMVDEEKVNIDDLKAIDGVMGVVKGETLQVIVGPGTVNKVAQKMVDMVGVKLGEPFPTAAGGSLEDRTAQMKKEAKEKYNKPSKIKEVLNSISRIFTPLIPAFVGAGLIGGIASIMANLITAGTIDGATFTQIVAVLGVIQKGIFAYLVIYVGINAATEFGATPSLGGVIGAVTMLTGITPEAPINNIFTGQPLSAQQGGIIGVIFAVWLLSLVEKNLRKVIPDSIDIIVTPTLSLLAIGLLTIFLIMPIAGTISTSLVGAINAVLNVGGGFAGFLLGALFLPMVMFGLHQILTPIHIEMIDKTGSTTLLPILAMAGAGQVGASLALWVRLRKNKEFAEIVKGALPVGFLGIGEPLIYGVTLPMGRPFITACIGGGIGGAVIGSLGHVGAIAIGPSGIALIPLIADNRWLIYIFGLIGGYVGGFIATYFFGIPQSEKDKADNYVDEKETTVLPNIEKTVASPMSGKIIPLTEVKDEVFSKGMLGQGFAIQPQDGKVFAPFEGTVTTIFPTKHAIGLLSNSGIEVLIHVGLDTVSLEGKPFTARVTEGSKIAKGDLLLEADLKEIEEAQLSPVTLVVITNSDSFKHIYIETPEEVTSGEQVIIAE